MARRPTDMTSPLSRATLPTAMHGHHILIAPATPHEMWTEITMAQRVEIQLIDDLTGDDIEAGGGEQISFALDGVTYEIDLSGDNAATLRESFEKYVAAARRTGGRKTTVSSGAKRGAATDPAQLAAIRDWARTHGYTVSDRGRIPTNVVEAFHQAH
ncbi:hypothetical protein GCM10009810_29610 [Nostocoides vanveenii]|uniref:Lsr2 family protein n=2 Tax=Nostocoides vanveenii TaxID=330835 RepID=A0ABN2KY25_9MICO